MKQLAITGTNEKAPVHVQGLLGDKFLRITISGAVLTTRIILTLDQAVELTHAMALWRTEWMQRTHKRLNTSNHKHSRKQAPKTNGGKHY